MEPFSAQLGLLDGYLCPLPQARYLAYMCISVYTGRPSVENLGNVLGNRTQAWSLHLKKAKSQNQKCFTVTTVTVTTVTVTTVTVTTVTVTTVTVTTVIVTTVTVTTKTVIIEGVSTVTVTGRTVTLITSTTES